MGRRFYNSDSEPEHKGKLEARQTDRQYINEYIGQQDCFRYFQSRSTQEGKGHFEGKVPTLGWMVGESGRTQVVGNQRQPELRGVKGGREDMQFGFCNCQLVCQ